MVMTPPLQLTSGACRDFSLKNLPMVVANLELTRFDPDPVVGRHVRLGKARLRPLARYDR